MGLLKKGVLQQWFLCGALGVLTACGGGGGGGSTPSSVTALSSVATLSSVAVSSVALSSAEKSSSSSSVPLSSSLSSAGLSSADSSASSSVLPNNRTVAHALWSFNAKTKIRSTAVTTETSVIFGSENGRLYALDLYNGSEQWNLDTGSAISSELLFADGKIIFMNFAGKIMAVDAVTGTQVWSLNTGGEHYRAWGHHLASALLVDDRIYIGSSSGKVYGLQLATGEQLWTMDLKSPVHTKPFMVNNTLYVSSDTAVHALDITTSKQLWSVPLQMPTSPAVANNTLVVGSRLNYVLAVDVTSGVERWRVSHGVDWVTGGPVIVDGVAYIGSSDDKKYQAIDLANGTVKWEIGMGANVFATPAFDGDISYISSGSSYASPGNGMVRAMHKDGRVLWSLNGKNFFSSPIVKNKHVYIGSDDNYFYALPAL